MINMSSKERHFDTPAISEACGKRELGSRHSSARAMKQLGGNASNDTVAARIWLAKFLTAFLFNLHPRLIYDA